MNKSSTDLSTRYWIISLYSKNIWIFVVILLFSIKVLIFLECIQLKNYQNWSHYHHSHIKLSNNEFLLICTHQAFFIHIPPTLRKTISWINTIKSAFILIISFYSKIRQTILLFSWYLLFLFWKYFHSSTEKFFMNYCVCC